MTVPAGSVTRSGTLLGTVINAPAPATAGNGNAGQVLAAVRDALTGFLGVADVGAPSCPGTALVPEDGSFDRLWSFRPGLAAALPILRGLLRRSGMRGAACCATVFGRGCRWSGGRAGAGFLGAGFHGREGFACSALRCADGYDQTVTGGAVVGRILQRSGVSAGELARRLGIGEGQVAAWMRGDPPLSVVDSVAHACSVDLAAVLAEPEPDPHDLSLLETTLAMTVDQRLERLKAYVRFVLAGRAALGIER